MSDAALLVVDLRSRQITVPAEVLLMRNEALAGSGVIGKVNSPETQAAAVEAQRGLATFTKLVERSRKAVKEPVLELCRAIDAKAEALASEVKAEEVRVAKLIGNYQADLYEAQKLADRAKQAELDRIQREKDEATRKAAAEAQTAIAAANNQAEKDAAMARAQAEAARQAELARQQEEAIKKAPEPVRSDGQVVRRDWDFEVTDIWTLARAHPGCVDIKPRKAEIKELLRMGVKVVGIRAWDATKSTVRTGGTKAIELQQ